MRPKTLRRLRRQAVTKQNHRCYYCHLPLWEEDGSVSLPGIPAKLVNYLRSTAEHLVARQDGGKDSQSNVVAACLWCNQSRHRGRQHCAPDPKAYKSQVSRLVAQGKWHPVIASQRARNGM